MTGRPARPRRGQAGAADPGGRRRRELTARLVHDVGKYLARTARNLPSGEAVDAALLAMLCRDLYGDSASTRPADRFTALAAELQPLLTHRQPTAAPLAALAAEFTELAGLELQVRAGAPAAVARAVALALQIEQRLRALATAAPPPPKRPAR